MNHDDTLKIMSVLKGSYPRQVIGSDTVAAYSSMLSDLPFDDVKSAIMRLVSTSKWFPAIAEIRAEAVRGSQSSLTPEEAWGQVHKAIGSVGSYEKPEFEDERVMQAVSAIGWKDICHGMNVMSTRARFIDAFKNIADRGTRALQLGAYGTEDDKQIAGRLEAPKPIGELLSNIKLLED